MGIAYVVAAVRALSERIAEVSVGIMDMCMAREDHPTYCHD